MNYYNKFEPRTAAWLRELISLKLIPDGHVDTRSITEVQPSDLDGFVQCHFFAGIGGWSLALHMAGWGDDKPVWSGSCPCQPYSPAGEGKGQSDERHLWPHFFRLIRECHPNTVFGEQVEGAIGHEWLDGVQGDLEREDYAVGHCVLGAHSVGAPHIRQRLYWVANSQREGLEGLAGDGHHGNQPGRIDAQPIGHASAGGESMRVADAAGGQREQCLRSQGDELQRLADNGADGGMGVANGTGRDAWESAATSARYGNSAESAGGRDQRMGNPESGGRGVMRDASQPGSCGHAISPCWSRFEIVHCRDGKARRFESQPQQMADGIPALMDALRVAGASEGEIQAALETFPLSQSVQGRVGLLKGYGNAIVPPLAALFIKSFMETQV